MKRTTKWMKEVLRMNKPVYLNAKFLLEELRNTGQLGTSGHCEWVVMNNEFPETWPPSHWQQTILLCNLNSNTIALTLTLSFKWNRATCTCHHACSNSNEIFSWNCTLFCARLRWRSCENGAGKLDSETGDCIATDSATVSLVSLTSSLATSNTSDVAALVSRTGVSTDSNCLVLVALPCLKTASMQNFYCIDIGLSPWWLGLGSTNLHRLATASRHQSQRSQFYSRTLLHLLQYHLNMNNISDKYR